MNDAFSDPERDAVYRAIHSRRDIRQFSSAPLPDDVLLRILEAAHAAPSVGFMQPWNFILIESGEVRSRIKKSFSETNTAEIEKVEEGERRELYRSLKLEGILESPMNIAVTCDGRRGEPFVLGRAPDPETDMFSTCLAVENMWLAARAEGVGVGWVSILNREAVEKILRLPDGIRLVAYLCVGYPVEFRPRPMLEEKGWRSRIGHYEFTAAQLKTMQEIITLLVFCGFSVIYLKEELKWNYLVGFCLMIAAAFFVFKK